jgi:alpha-1,2-mannosyltransferase
MYGWDNGTIKVCLQQVNSTWTKRHIDTIWARPRHTRIVYPPCDTHAMSLFSLEGDGRDLNLIISIAQFRYTFLTLFPRPEKRHDIQLAALALAKSTKVRLVCIGSARNKEDHDRADAILALADELDIADRVDVVRNASYPELLTYLSKAGMGVHTMRDEHFGIGVVEYMASGVIAIASDSGGPKSDIVANWKGGRTGLLKEGVQGVADGIDEVCGMGEVERVGVRERGRESVGRFTVDGFCAGFLECVRDVSDK